MKKHNLDSFNDSYSCKKMLKRLENFSLNSEKNDVNEIEKNIEKISKLFPNKCRNVFEIILGNSKFFGATR